MFPGAGQQRGGGDRDGWTACSLGDPPHPRVAVHGEASHVHFLNQTRANTPRWRLLWIPNSFVLLFQSETDSNLLMRLQPCPPVCNGACASLVICSRLRSQTDVVEGDGPNPAMEPNPAGLSAGLRRMLHLLVVVTSKETSEHGNNVPASPLIPEPPSSILDGIRVRLGLQHQRPAAGC